MSIGKNACVSVLDFWQFSFDLFGPCVEIVVDFDFWPKFYFSITGPTIYHQGRNRKQIACLCD